MIREVAGQDWRRDAACARPGVDPDVFYPLHSGPAGAAAVERAKAVCAGCPVRSACLRDAMAAEEPGERWGVIGGMSAEERAALHAGDRGATPAPDPVPMTPATPVLVSVVGAQLSLWEPVRGEAA
ncbi:WhiB family transcriptional regulator [Pseudonocardia hispaniensis]|uniref:WhiB family transcriptional regulator n=1 Tax=Pseudonocardia hispaniensis TaxID=904933 RepID=A0ABW1J0Z8_9PSEU